MVADCCCLLLCCSCLMRSRFERSRFEWLTLDWFWPSRPERLMFERLRLELLLMVVDCCGRWSGCVGLCLSEVKVGSAVEVGAIVDGCWLSVVDCCCRGQIGQPQSKDEYRLLAFTLQF